MLIICYDFKQVLELNNETSYLDLYVKYFCKTDYFVLFPESLSLKQNTKVYAQELLILV